MTHWRGNAMIGLALLLGLLLVLALVVALALLLSDDALDQGIALELSDRLNMNRIGLQLGFRRWRYMPLPQPRSFR